jgi:hypothetical protein
VSCSGESGNLYDMQYAGPHRSLGIYDIQCSLVHERSRQGGRSQRECLRVLDEVKV